MTVSSSALARDNDLTSPGYDPTAPYTLENTPPSMGATWVPTLNGSSGGWQMCCDRSWDDSGWRAHSYVFINATWELFGEEDETQGSWDSHGMSGDGLVLAVMFWAYPPVGLAVGGVRIYERAAGTANWVLFQQIESATINDDIGYLMLSEDGLTALWSSSSETGEYGGHIITYKRANRSKPFSFSSDTSVTFSHAGELRGFEPWHMTCSASSDARLVACADEFNVGGVSCGLVGIWEDGQLLAIVQFPGGASDERYYNSGWGVAVSGDRNYVFVGVNGTTIYNTNQQYYKEYYDGDCGEWGGIAVIKRSGYSWTHTEVLTRPADDVRIYNVRPIFSWHSEMTTNHDGSIVAHSMPWGEYNRQFWDPFKNDWDRFKYTAAGMINVYHRSGDTWTTGECLVNPMSIDIMSYEGHSSGWGSTCFGYQMHMSRDGRRMSVGTQYDYSAFVLELDPATLKWDRLAQLSPINFTHVRFPYSDSPTYGYGVSTKLSSDGSFASVLEYQIYATWPGVDHPAVWCFEECTN